MKIPTCLSCLAALATALLPLPAGAMDVCAGRQPVIKASPAPAGELLAQVRQFAITWQESGTMARPAPAATEVDGLLTDAALAARITRYADLPGGDLQVLPAPGEALAAMPDCPLRPVAQPPAT